MLTRLQHLSVRASIPLLAATVGLGAATAPAYGRAMPRHRVAAAVPRLVVSQINGVRGQFRLGGGQLTARYDAAVRAAAVGHRDPILPVPGRGTIAEYGLWGIEAESTLATNTAVEGIVRRWVFFDGWRGADTWNVDCSRPSAPGCNGHRRAVLSAPPVPHATLSIDAAYTRTVRRGVPSVSVAVLMVWTKNRA